MRRSSTWQQARQSLAVHDVRVWFRTGRFRCHGVGIFSVRFASEVMGLDLSNAMNAQLQIPEFPHHLSILRTKASLRVLSSMCVLPSPSPPPSALFVSNKPIFVLHTRKLKQHLAPPRSWQRGPCEGQSSARTPCCTTSSPRPPRHRSCQPKP